MGTGELSGKFFERLGLASNLGEKQYSKMSWKPSWDVQLIGCWSLRLDFFYFDQLKRLLCKSFSPVYIDHLIFGVGVGWDKIAIHIALYVMTFGSGVVGYLNL